MKKMVSLWLALLLALSLFPSAALAADTDNYSDVNVTWLGSQTEYQQTLDSFFQSGLRKIKVGSKWGMVDATGAFIAAPIYDKIEPYYLRYTSGPDNTQETRQRLFIGGYTQVVRNGRMGLLSAQGEEVIPAQYTAVGLPSEGICRIYTERNGTSYLGYWSLALGRELVAPKYAVPSQIVSAAGIAMEYTDSGRAAAPDGWGVPTDPNYAKTAGKLRALAYYDFRDGYALVPSGKQDGIFCSGNIIDKTGKEILPGGPHLYSAGYSDKYPQFGPYLVYLVEASSYAFHGTDLGRYWKSGVMGPSGVVIKAQYTSGVRRPITGYTLSYSRMRVLPEQGLVVTTKDVYPGQEDGGRMGVVNFKNQVVVPFVHDYESLHYDAETKCFVGGYRGNDGGSTRIYNTSGKVIGSTNYFEVNAFANGYCSFVKGIPTSTSAGYSYASGYVNVKTGKEYLPFRYESSNENRESSPVSTSGLVWLKNSAGKWRLVNLSGKAVLEQEFDAVSGLATTWGRSVNGYALVTSGKKQGVVTAAGKLLIPCEYDKLDDFNKGPADEIYLMATKGGRKGLLNVADGSTVIPCSYKAIGSSGDISYERTFFDLGVQVMQTSDGYVLVNRSGQVVPGSQRDKINGPYKGLFFASDGYIGPEGKVIFPETLTYSGRENFITDDMTLVVRDGQVGYINAAKLARTTQARSALPVKAPADPSPIQLQVDGKSVSVEAYAIGDSTYLKIRDIACILNGTAKSFNVSWSKAKNAIELRSGVSYTPISGDMAKGDGQAKSAVRSSAPVYVDGLQRILTAYTIGRSNFFRLRDVMQALDIYVGTDNGTVTLDTARGYQRTETESGGWVDASTEVDAPPAAQVNKLEILKSPNLEFYMTGDHTFRTAGFELRYWDESGTPHSITDTSQMVFTVEGKVIEDGYVFTVSSMKTGTVGYMGLTAPLRFPVYQGIPEIAIDDVPGQSGDGIADGTYTLSVYGKSIGLSNGWVIIDDSNPVAFTVRRSGDYYYMYVTTEYGVNYVDISPLNKQLTTKAADETAAAKWKITDLGDGTYSIRQYGRQQMIVNACGQQSKDGTTIIVYQHTDTPRNATLTFTPA